jgi:hypothetical protein
MKKIILISLMLIGVAHAKFGMNECETVCKNVGGVSQCYNTCEYQEGFN